MDLFDIIMLSFIAIVGFAAVSSNIKEKMEERGKESGKEKELKKNIILCALIFMTASVALPILLWYIGFSKQGVGAVIATFVLVDFVFLFSLIGVLIRLHQKNLITLLKILYQKYNTHNRLEKFILHLQNQKKFCWWLRMILAVKKFQEVRNILFLCYNKKQKNKKKQRNRIKRNKQC